MTNYYYSVGDTVGVNELLMLNLLKVLHNIDKRAG